MVLLSHIWIKTAFTHILSIACRITIFMSTTASYSQFKHPYRDEIYFWEAKRWKWFDKPPIKKCKSAIILPLTADKLYQNDKEQSTLLLKYSFVYHADRVLSSHLGRVYVSNRKKYHDIIAHWIKWDSMTIWYICMYNNFQMSMHRFKLNCYRIFE